MNSIALVVTSKPTQMPNSASKPTIQCNNREMYSLRTGRIGSPPPKDNTEVPTPTTPKATLFGKGVFVDVIKLRSGRTRLGRP